MHTDCLFVAIGVRRSCFFVFLVKEKKGEKIALVFDVVKLNFYGVLLLGEIGGLRFCVWLLVP